MAALPFRDTRTMVDNPQSSIATERNGNLRPHWCMADGVLYQVARDFVERFLGSQHDEGFALHIQCQGNAPRRRKMGQRLGSPAHDAGCIQLFYAAPIGPLEPREAQELPYNAPHALNFLAQNR